MRQKNFMTLFIALVLIAVPVGVFATAPEPEPVLVTVADIKAYGDQSANFSIGAFDVVVKSNTTSDFVTVDWKVYGNVAGNFDGCEGLNCGMIQTVGNINTAYGTTNSTTTLSGYNVAGGADMQTMGGLAACAMEGLTEGIPSGSLDQSQTVTNLYKVNIPVGATGAVTGTSSYSGTQNLNLSISP